MKFTLKNTKSTREKIITTLQKLLQEQSRFSQVQISESTHFDRDLHLTQNELKNFIQSVEITFEITITSNALVFIREIGQLVFYLESKIFDQ